MNGDFLGEFTLAGDNPAGFGILAPSGDAGSFSDSGGFFPNFSSGLGIGSELGLVNQALGTFPGGQMLEVQQPAPATGAMVGIMRRIPPIVQTALAKIAGALQRRNITVAAAIALARRVGIPGLTALGLTIAEIAGLLLWHQTHKRRRMNVLNPKALRRSTRRLLGFERRAAKVAFALSQLAPRRRGGARGRARGCFVCHRSPCVCP